MIGLNGSEPNYATEKELCAQFITQFEAHGVQKYMSKVESLIGGCSDRIFEISLADLRQFDSGDDFTDLWRNITRNARRYVDIFAEVVGDFLEQISAEHDDSILYDAADAYSTSRNHVPPSLRRTFRIAFKAEETEPPVKLRQIRASSIGHLVNFRGICTRISDVKPLMEVACFTCDVCDQATYQEISGESFVPLTTCPSKSCKTSSSGTLLFNFLENSPDKLKVNLVLETRNSKFIGFQEAKIQELPEDVPVGHTPRSLTIHLKGSMTRSMGPGNIVDVYGIFLPNGQKPLQNHLLTTTYVDVMTVRKHKSDGVDIGGEEQVRKKVQKYRHHGDFYARLASSIAPEIYGHNDIKKALLLLLCSGVSRRRKDGVSIRGDIHICLMGDPGVAKSQLLKHIVQLAPRAVYTTGRGSSGVGLTAAVQRDSVTGEMILEGGALVLADNGICCIDEFDKMDESDRTAIHEVMEQQTVSIAKAGITTTLNARTTVLAAANPAFGRYRLTATPQENINLPAALLSRFDLLWLILDSADVDNDFALAHHVLHVHKCGQPPTTNGESHLPMEELRAYVALSQRFEPHIPTELAEYIANAYAEMRSDEVQAADSAQGYTTARTLLSILRLAQALARPGWSNVVSEQDVNEALRLMKMSKMSLEKKTVTVNDDNITVIYRLVRQWAGLNNGTSISYNDALSLSSKKGFSKEALDTCLREYEALDVWLLDEEQNITFIE